MSSQQIETVNLNPNEKVQTVRLGDATLQRGYVYRCEPDSDDAISGDPGDENSPPWAFGFHGTDTPPCAAEYLADGDQGYLVLSTEESAEEIETVDGWTLTPAELEVGEVFADGCWTVVVVKRHVSSHEYTVAGTL